MSDGLVSVIMPSYNCGRFVEETIRSVQAQTYQNWEIIFVDDCSKDDTMSKVMALKESDKRIKVYQNPQNCGAAVSRNLALREAKGRWIAFLDSDDLWKPEKLEKQVKFMEDNGYKFSCTYSEDIDENGKDLEIVTRSPLHITKTDMFNYCCIGCLTAMYDSNYIGLIQIEDIQKNNDYAMWLKIIKKSDCYCLPEVLAKYRKRGGSISRHSKFKLIKWHYLLFRKAEGQSVIESIFNTVRNLFFGVIKKLFYVRKK